MGTEPDNAPLTPVEKSCLLRVIAVLAANTLDMAGIPYAISGRVAAELWLLPAETAESHVEIVVDDNFKAAPPIRSEFPDARNCMLTQW